MKTTDRGFTVRTIAGAMFTLSCMLLVPPPARGDVEIFKKDDFSLNLGLRIQPRMDLDRVPASSGGTEWARDFLIRRARIKASGKMQRADYKFEVKIDRTDQSSVTPTASVENAYIQYPLLHGLDVRAGLYDQPFSRDLLTSDSKQLAVDRGAVSNVPNALGLADNAVGFDLRGKLEDGHALYAVGVFDNRLIANGFQTRPMVVGRLDFNFGSTKDVLQDAHFGPDSWYSVGLNGSYQGSIENAAGQDDGSNSAGGLDGMIDVPAGPTRLFARSEINVIKVETPGGGNPVDTTVWMVAAGVSVFGQRLQPMVRFDEVRLDDASGGGVRDITFIGANFYQKEHSLKLQGDVRAEAGTGKAVDGVRLQAQMDF